ncbi:MAG TPA: HAD-IC family P-type ATPase, partial [Variovorax sp.]|nr:HAD-IC family P-type ATPase [Variovorax sp.]
GGAPGEMELVDAAELRVGDRVRVLPGDTIAADGEIVLGSTTIDQASITGESLPIDAEPGSRVYAGTTNLTGAFELKVTKTGDDTVIGRVTQIVEEAKTSRAPVMRLIDEYTRYYMPFVLIVAGFVLFFTRDVERAISVIIVAMPCAFVLASPSAMVAALAVASRLGILVKSSRFFEVAQSIDTIVFDKTGTLTTGQLRVIALEPAEDSSDDELLAAAAALEVHSTHPVARAIIAEAQRRAVPFDRTLQIEEAAGRGVRGGAIAAGRRSWLESQGVVIPATVVERANASTLYVSRNGTWLGAILLADAIRAETRDAAEGLRALGIEEFVMLTGDRAQPVQVQQHLRPVHEVGIAAARGDAAVEALAQLADHPGGAFGRAIEHGLEQREELEGFFVPCVLVEHEALRRMTGEGLQQRIGRRWRAHVPAMAHDGEAKGPQRFHAGPRAEGRGHEGAQVAGIHHLGL